MITRGSEPPELLLREGVRGRPCVVLIHGLGVNADFWFHPDRVRVMAGLAPLSWFLKGGKEKRAAVPVFADTLARSGFHLAAWSQRRPVGPLDLAVEELEGIAERIRGSLGEVPLILIGHSRGGLVARRWLGRGRRKGIRGLITLGTPHEGSALARWIDLLEPLGRACAGLLRNVETEGLTREVLERLTGFLTSPGVRELEPGSQLLRETAAGPLPEGVFRKSYAGTDPGLLAASVRGAPSEILFPHSFARFLPATRIPEELQPGRGDGLVAVRRARLSAADPHEDLPFNHVTMAFDPEIARRISAICKTISS